MMEYISYLSLEYILQCVLCLIWWLYDSNNNEARNIKKIIGECYREWCAFGYMPFQVFF